MRENNVIKNKNIEIILVNGKEHNLLTICKNYDGNKGLFLIKTITRIYKWKLPYAKGINLI